MTIAERDEIIGKTLKHEGGFGIDTYNGWVYMGVNSKSNPTWSGWDIIEPLVNRKRFEVFDTRSAGVYDRIWDNPLLTQQVMDLAASKYWSGNSFESYNDRRVVSNLFDQNYTDGMITVIKCAFGTEYKLLAANKANIMGEEALPVLIECRMKYYSSLKYNQTDQTKIDQIRQRQIKRVYDLNLDSSITGPGYSYVNFADSLGKLYNSIVNRFMNDVMSNIYLENLNRGIRTY